MQRVISCVVATLTLAIFTASTAMSQAASSAGNGTIDGFAAGWMWSGMGEVDDSALAGGRAHGGGPGGYGSYTFTGTGVEVWGIAGSTAMVDGQERHLGSLKISIDGKRETTTTARRGSTVYHALLGRVLGLAPGIHVLEVSPEDGWAVVDGIKVVDANHPPSNDGPSTGTSGAADTNNVLGAPVVMVNVGGAAVGDWQADTGEASQAFRVYSGTTALSGDAIDTSAATDPAPAAVYQSERWGPCGFVFPALAPGAAYNIRLDFAETYYSQPRARLFDVVINNVPVLTDFDIFAAAGGKDRASDVVLHARADSQGQIAIAFLKGAADNPEICGISIFKP